jgi:hypothetical protein
MSPEARRRSQIGRIAANHDPLGTVFFLVAEGHTDHAFPNCSPVQFEQDGCIRRQA